MKNFLVTILWTIVLGSTVVRAENDGIISGKTIPGTKVMLQYDRGRIRTEAETKADDSGNFSLNCTLDRPGIYSLVTDAVKGGVPVFIKPGWHVKVDFTGEEIIFGENGMRENRLLQKINAKEAELAEKYPQNMSDASVNQTVLFKRFEEIQKFLNGLTMQDAEFAGTLQASLAFRAYYSILNYPFIFQLINNGKTLDLPKEYYDFLTEVDLSSPYLANLGNINLILQEIFTAMENQGYLKSGMSDYLLKRADKLKDSKVREEYLLYAINIELFGYNQYLGKMMKQIASLITSSAGQAQLETFKEKYAKQSEACAHLNAGQKAADFYGVDVAGQKHALSDYLGKVVVVDVWNTGCKPCIAEIPFLNKLEEKFANKDVVFISLSLEGGIDKWKEFLKKRDMHGNQWIETAAFKSAFAKNYHVSFVPRFMVFDKKGRIVETYAPRPSNPRLATLIEEELKHD